MVEAIHREAAALLLSAIYRDPSPDGIISSFFYGKPGSPMWDRRIGTEICYRRREMVRAVLCIRQNGPAYLKYLSINNISRMLQEFVRENFWHLRETLFKHFSCSYAEYLAEETKLVFADALASSAIFTPVNELTLFPLVPVRVDADFVSTPFFLISPESLTPQLGYPDAERWIEPEPFPPLKEWEGKTETPSAWLGVRSPAVQSSEKMRSAVLGAIALTPLPGYRHQFSMRTMFGGRCTIGGGTTISSGSAHTPPMAEDIVVTEMDHAWLSLLATKLLSSEKRVRRELRALEYFYRAWPLDESERFPVLCMVLDAVFGDANEATQAVINGVRGTIGEHVSEPRLRLLMEIRASVIHGGAPDVYDSRKYARYYDRYGEDPIFDLGLVVARCLRRRIFDDALVEHPDPNARLIADLQAKGRLPKGLGTRPTILTEGQRP